MRNILLILTAILFVFTACQKEPSFEDPSGNPGGGGTGGGTTVLGLLVRVVEVSGADSNITVYTYDAAKRVIQIDASNTQGVSLVYKIVRNSSGIVTRTLVTSPQFALLGIDSIPTRYFYNTATSRYTHTRYDISLSGIPYSDSTALNYDAGGNLVNSISYALIGGSYEPLSKAEYTYAGGNVSSQKYSDYDALTASYTLDETSTFTYDAKVSPAKFGAEGVLFGMPTTFGNNNATVLNYSDATDPSNDFTHTSTLTYNTANKPSGGTKVENPGSINFNLRFYYN